MSQESIHPMPQGVPRSNYLTFDDLPKEFKVWDCSAQAAIPARCLPMNRQDAVQRIDKIWWEELNLPREIKRAEPDRAWLWSDLFGEVKAQHAGYGRGWMLEADGRIQGCILFNVRSKSIFDVKANGEPIPAVYVHYLATAPRNRPRLEAYSPTQLRGVGTALMKLAIAQSYYIDGGGRVNLLSADHPETIAWYEDFGFKRTSTRAVDPLVFELTQEAASPYLKEMGL